MIVQSHAKTAIFLFAFSSEPTQQSQGYLEHRDRLLCLFRTFRLTTVVLRSAIRLTIGRLNDRSHCETARIAHCALTKSRARVGL